MRTCEATLLSGKVYLRVVKFCANPCRARPAEPAKRPKALGNWGCCCGCGWFILVLVVAVLLSNSPQTQSKSGAHESKKNDRNFGVAFGEAEGVEGASTGLVFSQDSLSEVMEGVVVMGSGCRLGS